MKKIKINWSDFLLEIVSVFIGITIAFAIDNWATERQLQKDEMTYIKGMMVDLDTEIEQLNSVLKEILLRDSLGREHAIQLFKGDIIDRDLIEFAESVGFYQEFEPGNVTLQALISSGRLDVISNNTLLYELIKHYSANSNVALIDKKYMGLVDDYSSYVIEHFDVLDFILVSDSLLTKTEPIKADVKYRNLALAVIKFNQLRLEKHYYFKEKKQELYDLLAKELENN